MKPYKPKLYIPFALLAAILYAVNIPFSKLLLDVVEPILLSAFLYLGSGIGMSAYCLATHKSNTQESFTRKDAPYVIGMIVLDIAAPICLMIGLQQSVPASVSLLNNFEIVATSLLGCLLFKESISKRMWIAIGVISLASILLSFENTHSFTFSVGSLFVIAACTCWGLENNCTCKLSAKNPAMIVVLKGIFSGLSALVIALCMGETLPGILPVLLALLLGFFSYGLSIFFYVKAQRGLGAAKTSAFYAINPFIGALLSLLIFRQPLPPLYVLALITMIIGTILSIWDGTKEA